MKTAVLTTAIGAFLLILFLTNQRELGDRIKTLDRDHQAALGRLHSSEREVTRLKSQTRDHSQSLDDVKHALTRATGHIEALEAAERFQMGQLEKTLARRLDDLQEELKHGSEMQLMVKQEVDSIKHSMTRDLETMSREILSPSVKISYKTSVGGGTILYSRKDGKGQVYTYILTAYHVVHKAVERKEKEKEEIRRPVEVQVYAPGSDTSRKYTATLVTYDEKKDLALLHLELDRPAPRTALLLSRSRSNEIRVFTPIYAVGCPLGHDPIPTLGEVANLNKKVGGERFFMMSAPTIFGNSGGGIFHRDTHELLGISAMVCTYENLLSTPVPHLGIFISIDTIYDWLDGEHMQFLYNPAVTRDSCEAQRTKHREGLTDLVKVIWEE